MHTARLAQVLTVLLLAACSSDRLTSVAKVPPPPAHLTVNRTSLLNNSGSPATTYTLGGINEPGVVAGSLIDGSRQVATIWSPPGYKPTALPLPGDTGISIGTRIANDGTVLGKICDSTGQACRWVTWKNGTITPVTPQGDARDICPCDGQVIVGGLMVDGVQHPVVWTHGKVLDPGVPPGFTSAEFVAVDEGFMAATAVGPRGTAPFRWSPQFGYQTLPVTGGNVAALDVNALGTVLADDNHVYPLGGPAIAAPSDVQTTGAFLDVTAINDSSWVTGVFIIQPPFALPPPAGAVWNPFTNTVLDVGGFDGSQSIDINNAGLVLGRDGEDPEAWVIDLHSH